MQDIKTREEIGAILASNDYVIIDFWAPWCGPCKAMMPTLNKLSAEISNVRFSKLNVDDSAFENVVVDFNVKAVPTLLLFRRGEHVETSTGVKTEGMLREMVKKLTSK